jgi:PAS domain S-box-containing protein
LKKKINILSKTEKNILEAIPGAAAIMDEDGAVIAVNNAWKEGSNCPCWIDPDQTSNNIFEYCQKLVAAGNDYALRMILNLREITDSEKKSAELTVSVNDDESTWFRVSISSIEENPKKILLIFNDITSNMQALMSLRDSEEKYSHHFKYSVSGIILGDATGKILDANPSACMMLGYSREELIKGGRSLIVDEKHPAHLEMIQARQENAYYEGEKEYIHKDGSVIPVEITSVLYRNGEGSLNVINTFRDKTVEKKTQFSLEEERRFSQTALNSIPGIFIVVNQEGNLERWNNALNHELGYSAEELKSLHCISLFDSEDKPWVQSVIKKIFETGSGNFVARVSSKSNEERFYHFHFNKFVSHNKEYLVATAVDKTDYIKAENEREKNFELMSQLFENSPLAMVMIGSDGYVQRVNDSFTTLFGFSENEVIDADVNTLIAPEENQADSVFVNEQAFKGIADTQETTRLTKSGQNIPVLVTTVPIIYDDEVIAVYGIYVDLREQKELEISLQESVQEKDILLQEVHHRVKNNLAIIAGLIDLQIIHENEQNVIKKLQEIHSRVFSIAKIHETLYQQKDMVFIDFTDYLQNVIHSLYAKDMPDSFSFAIESDAPVNLNLNQAVPLSLAINELINIKRNLHKSDGTEILIRLKHGKDTIQVQINGLDGIIDKAGEKDETSFEFLLLNTFLNQIQAHISYLKNGEKKIEIRFQKNDTVKGSSNGFIYK